MITLLNRRELARTHSMEKQADIRSVLSHNDIDYVYQIVNRKDAGIRVATGSFGEDPALMSEHVFYVHKKDFELAKNMISKGLG